MGPKTDSSFLLLKELTSFAVELETFKLKSTFKNSGGYGERQR